MENYVLAEKIKKYLAVHHCLFALSWSFLLISDVKKKKDNCIGTSVNTGGLYCSFCQSGPQCKTGEAVCGKSREITLGENFRVWGTYGLVVGCCFFPLLSSPLPHLAVRFDRQILGSSSFEGGCAARFRWWEGQYLSTTRLGLFAWSPAKSALRHQLLLNQTALLPGNSALPRILRTGK